MGISYAREKLYLSIRDLATGEGDARERLGDVFVYHLIHLKSEDLPEYHWKKLVEIRKKISKRTPPSYYDIGAIKYSLKFLKNKTASKFIQQIIEMAEEVGALRA